MAGPLSKGRWLALAGLCVTAVILTYFARRLDWAEFAAALRTVRLPWLAAAAASIVCSVAVRALRWQQLTHARGQLHAFWNATVVGYAGNIVYPARAGEALRIVAASRLTGIEGPRAVASAFADRLSDVFALGAVALAVLGLARLGPHDERVMAAVVLLSALPLAVFAAFLRWGKAWSAWLHRLSERFPGRLARELPRWFAQGVEHTQALREPALILGVVALTLLAMMLDYAAIWCVMYAMDWQLPALAAVLVGVLLALGTLVPAAPGYVGIYQVACVVGLARYGMGEAPALAFSVVLQAVVIATMALQAAVVFAHYGWRLRGWRAADPAGTDAEGRERNVRDKARMDTR